MWGGGGGGGGRGAVLKLNSGDGTHLHFAKEKPREDHSEAENDHHYGGNEYHSSAHGEVYLSTHTIGNTD